MKYLRSSIIFTTLIAATPGLAADTTGAGSTFVSPVMAKWIDIYKTKTGNTVSYQPWGRASASA